MRAYYHLSVNNHMPVEVPPAKIKRLCGTGGLPPEMFHQASTNLSTGKCCSLLRLVFGVKKGGSLDFDQSDKKWGMEFTGERD